MNFPIRKNKESALLWEGRAVPLTTTAGTSSKGAEN